MTQSTELLEVTTRYKGGTYSILFMLHLTLAKSQTEVLLTLPKPVSMMGEVTYHSYSNKAT